MGVLVFEYTLASLPPDLKIAQREILKDPQWEKVQQFGVKSVAVKCDALDARKGTVSVTFDDVASARKAAKALPSSVKAVKSATSNVTGSAVSAKFAKPRVLTAL